MSDSTFHMKNSGRRSTEDDPLQGLMKALDNAERQVGTVLKLKTKQTTVEHELNDKLANSAQTLLAGLRGVLKKNDYDAIVRTVVTWETKYGKELTTLQGLARKSVVLAPLAALVAYIADIRNAADQL